MKRPGFQKMITAIEAGYISAVFVKDLSRLGRNYIEVGRLTEEFFPQYDVRLVAVSDGVDSDEGDNEFTPFRNIMNEWYAKDNFHFNQKNHDIKYFSCQNHNSGLRKCSATHYIRLDFLEQVVLYEVNRLAAFAYEYEHDFVKAMLGRSAKVAENDRTRKQRELNALLTRDKELDMLFERLYEDNVAGKIDDARFAKMSKRYEQEQGENAGKIKALRLELKKVEGQQMDMEDFLQMVRRYTHVTKITRRMVSELIDHIDVYHAEKQDGVTNQRIVIHYNCIGAFEVPDRKKIPEADIIMETRKGVAVSYAPSQVAV